ncbi:MAG: hypothetical protein CMM46_02045 [Rhodospirillaceae bacterium]|nr:hypothetical protein [Rhodospirillaceae bacterium]
MSASTSLFSLQSGDLLPVPLNGSVVDVPLFLAHDQGTAATASLADAAGMTWAFAEDGLRFELDGFVLEPADPGATMTFTTSGIVLNGFALMPL